jgi:hypothetical protein
MGPPNDYRGLYFEIASRSRKLNLVFSGGASHAHAMAMNLRVFMVLAALGLSLSAFADEVINPPGGKGWGGGASAESLLNMNRDPESVRRVDPEKVPIPIRGTCTDEQGRTFTGDDEDYALCMNRRMSKKTAASPTASTTTSRKN